MTQLTTINILLLLLGFALQVLMTLKTAIREKTFSLKFWIRHNWIEGLISIVTAFAVLIMGPDLIELFGIKADDGSPFYLLHAFVCGYMGREMIFRVLGWVKKPSATQPPPTP